MTSWRAGAFGLIHHAGRLVERVGRGLRYVGAGFLDPAAFRHWSERTWRDYSASEAEVMAGLTAWERAFYPRFLPDNAHLLLIGSGSGRDVIGLLALGHRVDGIDLSSAATARGREMLRRRGLEATLRTGAIEDVPIDGSYDAVVFSAGCYGYIPESRRRIAVLEKLRAALPPGGRVLLSVTFAERAGPRLALAVTALGTRLTRAGWRPEPGDTIQELRGGLYFEHYFAPGDLEREAAAGGFTLVFRDDWEGTAVLQA